MPTLNSTAGLLSSIFDHLNGRLPDVRQQMIKRPDTVAVFLSPGGNGLKAVIRIADGAKHRRHYKALMDEIVGLDEKNINETRVCFESYDPAIYINYNATPYTKFIEPVTTGGRGETGRGEKFFTPMVCTTVLTQHFALLEKWLLNKGSIFASGNRNNYIFCLASACCRFGITEEEAILQITLNYLAKDTGFTTTEALHAIKSAYKRNQFATAELSNGTLVERSTQKEIEPAVDDHLVRDVIYGADVYNDALDLFNHGYKYADTTGIKQIDGLFKWKRGELTVLTGIGNHGKSAILSFLMLNKAAKDGSKWAVFSPENYPAHEYYHDLTETVLGADCTPDNHINKPTLQQYQAAYDFVRKHFFYIYPQQLAPSPEYIKSRFLELIIKEKVDGCVIDPFNQLANDYSRQNHRDDKYLETFLSDATRFSITSNVYMIIVAHPVKLHKNEAGGYDAPDAFDLAGGAMWNNKADNILVYHRPNRHTDPNDRTCELHTRKIRRQKIVGTLGSETFQYNRLTRRFDFPDFPLLHLQLNTQTIPAQPPDGEEAPF